MRNHRSTMTRALALAAVLAALAAIPASAPARLAIDPPYQDVPAPSRTVATTSNGFDWGDAAVGAAFTLGMILLVTAGGVIVRRHTRHQSVAVS